MAKLVSNELGTEEIEEVKESTSYGANSIRDGVSLSKQRITRPLVSYPEVIELPDLTMLVRLPGSYPITKLKLELEIRNKNAVGFIERQLPEAVKKEATEESKISVKGGEAEMSSLNHFNESKKQEASFEQEIVYID